MIKDIKEKIIKDFIAKELLADSIAPTLDSICALAVSRYGNSDINAPLFKPKHVFKNNEPARSAVYNNLATDLSIDIGTLYKFIDYTEMQLDDLNKAIDTKTKRMKAELKALEERLHSMIMLSSDSEGFYDIVNIPLNDLEESTCFYDTANKTIGSGFDSTEGYVLNSVNIKKPITITNLNKETVRTTRMEDDGFIVFTNVLPVDFNSYSEISVLLMLDGSHEINKITMNINDECYASCSAYYNDSWNELSKYKKYNSIINIGFGKITTDKILIRIKTGEFELENKLKKYITKISNVKIGMVSFLKTSLFTTKAIDVNNIRHFMLKDVSELPEGAQINYSMSSSSDGTTWSVFTGFDKDKVITIVPTTYTPVECVVDLTGDSIYNAFENVAFDVSLEKNVLKVIRGKHCLDTSNANMYFAVLYNPEDNTYMNLSATPCYLNGSNTETNAVEKLNVGINTFAFKRVVDIKAIYDLFSGYTWGAYLANKTDVNNHHDNDEWFSIIEHNGENKILAPKLMNGDFLHINSDYSTDTAPYEETLIALTEDTDSAVTNIKLKAELVSDGSVSPQIRNINIKVR